MQQSQTSLLSKDLAFELQDLISPVVHSSFKGATPEFVSKELHLTVSEMISSFIHNEFLDLESSLFLER